MQVHLKTKFLDDDAVIIVRRYENGRPAILAVSDDEVREQLMCFTVNLPDTPIGLDKVAIKDYSENEGALSALIEIGLVKKPCRYIPSGFVTIPICELTDKGKDFVDANLNN